MALLDRAIVRVLPAVPRPVVKKLSRRYIASSTLVEACRVVNGLNEEGKMATIDVLGEEITGREEATALLVEYEDVFGNWATRFEVTQPYTELTIEAESLVEVMDVDPFAFAKLPIRPASFPLVWMPWERTMLAPYLTPAELPDTQLQELTDYGMQFVNRNGDRKSVV